MNEVFRQEWELYQKDGARPSFRGVEPKSGAVAFDAPVKVGEVRVFADMNRPFVALVLADEGTFGFRIVPVSPFTVPASARERLVGARVYQLWNACAAARSFVARSWVVEALGAADVADVAAALAKVPSGAVSEDGTAAAYERAFRVAGGNFRLLQGTPAKARSASWFRYVKGGLVAALLLVGCAIGVVVYFGPTIMATRNVMCAAMFGGSTACAVREVRENRAMDYCFCPDRDGGQTLSAAAECCECEETIPAPSVPDRSNRQYCNGEEYAAVEENEFLNPKDSPLSTFGLDVDTSSYALMRSSLVDYRRLPHKDSVRVEEYVNYFKYDYARAAAGHPQNDHPISVDCELAACPWNARHKLLRLGVQATRADGVKLPPCNLTFLIDVSGSMHGENRLGLLKRALGMLVGKLRAEDHVAVVTYASSTRVVLPSVSGREKREILRVIDALEAGGGTAGGDGLQLAYAEARKNFDRRANNRVILVTDGDFNIGISSRMELEDFIAEKRDSGIFLTVFGVGRGNFMDSKMKRLSSAGNGNYAYLDSLLEAKKVMLTEFGGTLMTVAKDVKVQVEFNPSEVEGYRLLGYENRRLAAKDFNDDKKDAGEIGLGHAMTAFYEIVPAGGAEKVAGTDPLKYQTRAAAASGELCTVKLRYKRPDGDRSILVAEAHKASDITRKAPSEDFRFASAVAEYALLLKGSKFKGDASFADVLERARGAKGEDREGYRAEFIRLVERAELLSPQP